MELKALAEKNHDYVVEMRRYFHRHPELSTQEVNTSKKICEELEKMGYKTLAGRVSRKFFNEKLFLTVLIYWL